MRCLSLAAVASLAVVALTPASMGLMAVSAALIGSRRRSM